MTGKILHSLLGVFQRELVLDSKCLDYIKQFLLLLKLTKVWKYEKRVVVVTVRIKETSGTFYSFASSLCDTVSVNVSALPFASLSCLHGCRVQLALVHVRCL